MDRNKENINLEFTYMHKDKELAHIIEYSNGKVEMDLYSDDFLDNPLRNGVNKHGLERFFEDRCFPRSRANARELLDLLGLDHYNPRYIVMETHGVQYDDFYWIKFDGETISWSDVKVRD